MKRKSQKSSTKRWTKARIQHELIKLLLTDGAYKCVKCKETFHAQRQGESGPDYTFTELIFIKWYNRYCGDCFDELEAERWNKLDDQLINISNSTFNRCAKKLLAQHAPQS